jgi:hypothetical protein
MITAYGASGAADKDSVGTGGSLKRKSLLHRVKSLPSLSAARAGKVTKVPPVAADSMAEAPEVKAVIQLAVTMAVMAAAALLMCDKTGTR